MHTTKPLVVPSAVSPSMTKAGSWLPVGQTFGSRGPTLQVISDHAVRPDDEFANFLTHGLGFLLSLPAAIILLQMVGDATPELRFATLVYCLSLVGLYAASTLSHTFYTLHWRLRFRVLDQICIYLLIAGSFTPFAVAYLPLGWQSPLLLATWLIAILGGILCWLQRGIYGKWMLSYLLMGWFPAISIGTIIEAGPAEMISWIVAGGLFYTCGTLFLYFDRSVRYLHALWHTSVIAGSLCHYLAILKMIESM